MKKSTFSILIFLNSISFSAEIEEFSIFGKLIFNRFQENYSPLDKLNGIEEGVWLIQGDFVNPEYYRLEITDPQLAKIKTNILYKFILKKINASDKLTIGTPVEILSFEEFKEVDLSDKKKDDSTCTIL